MDFALTAAGVGRFGIAQPRKDHISLGDSAGIDISESQGEALFKGQPGSG